MNEVWTRWEGQIVNGVFPLQRFVRASDHSGVFLTSLAAQNIPTAAIKLIPAVPKLAEAQLVRWAMVTALAHPHLIRLFESGRCQIQDLEFIFVVMEYAEQTLSQILPQRPLTADEAREMLPPTLSALAFLHGRNLVHGQLKPSNFLVVDDQLKLASDTIRPAGETTATAAGDIWSLGVTLTEALTQHASALRDGGLAPDSLAAAVPQSLVNIVSRCLNQNPAARPTAAQLEAELNPPARPPQPSSPSAPQASSPSAPQAAVTAPKQPGLIPSRIVAKAPNRTTSPAASPLGRFLVLAAAAILILVVALWGASRLLNSKSSSQPVAESTAIAQSPEISPNPAAATPPAIGSAVVVHEEIPEVSRHARDTIRGHIKIAVRVTVDSSGNVVNKVLESRGSSYYFARLAAEAAGKWKFTPADQGSRKWLLQFEFSRDGVTGRATPSKS